MQRTERNQQREVFIGAPDESLSNLGNFDIVVLTTLGVGEVGPWRGAAAFIFDPEAGQWEQKCIYTFTDRNGLSDEAAMAEAVFSVLKRAIVTFFAKGQLRRPAVVVVSDLKRLQRWVQSPSVRGPAALLEPERLDSIIANMKIIGKKCRSISYCGPDTTEYGLCLRSVLGLRERLLQWKMKTQQIAR